MVDHTDEKILSMLKQNSRQSWKEIGKEVFLTGQAVQVRVSRLKDKGVIQKFTIIQGAEEIQFIQFYMTTSLFESLEQVLKKCDQVLEVYKTTGDSCYAIKTNFQGNADLNIFLKSLRRFGRYKISTVLKKIV